MELKKVNSNGDNVVATNLNYVNFFHLKIAKIKLKNKPYIFIFKNNCPRNIFLILFTLLINIE
jgi:hypothetical protein